MTAYMTASPQSFDQGSDQRDHQHHYLYSDCIALVWGGGDLASGAIYRLRQAGFPVVVAEIALPTMVRTTISYGIAVTHGAALIEGYHSRFAKADDVSRFLADGMIPVLVDPRLDLLPQIKPTILIDARLNKVNDGLRTDLASVVIALGPGYTAGVDCHAVIETNRGHFLGRVFRQGTAEPNTGVPGAVNGITGDRVLRAPAAGRLWQRKVIGQRVYEGDLLAYIEAQEGDQSVLAPFEGVIRGLIDDETYVTQGMKIGDLDPRLKVQHCFTLSDKSLAVGGGVVEAVLSSAVIRDRIG